MFLGQVMHKVALGNGGLGVGECFRERVLNSPLSDTLYMYNTNWDLFVQGELYVFLKDSYVNTHLVVKLSQKILTFTS